MSRVKLVLAVPVLVASLCVAGCGGSPSPEAPTPESPLAREFAKTDPYISAFEAIFPNATTEIRRRAYGTQFVWKAEMVKDEWMFTMMHGFNEVDGKIVRGKRPPVFTGGKKNAAGVYEMATFTLRDWESVKDSKGDVAALFSSGRR